jgi:hypothetical protein
VDPEGDRRADPGRAPHPSASIAPDSVTTYTPRSSFVVFGLTYLKVFFFDTTGLEHPQRIVSLLVLGVVLLVASWVYARYLGDLAADGTTADGTATDDPPGDGPDAGETTDGEPTDSEPEAIDAENDGEEDERDGSGVDGDADEE